MAINSTREDEELKETLKLDVLKRLLANLLEYKGKIVAVTLLLSSDHVYSASPAVWSAFGIVTSFVCSSNSSFSNSAVYVLTPVSTQVASFVMIPPSSTVSVTVWPSVPSSHISHTTVAVHL